MAPPADFTACDVWVSTPTRHVPAHRILTPRPSTPTDPPFTLLCTPHVVTKGKVISRAQARALPVFPCVRCFGYTPVSPERWRK